MAASQTDHADAVVTVLDSSGQGHSDAQGESVSERAGCRFNAGSAAGAHMFRQRTAGLCVTGEFLAREEPPFGQGGVKGARGVTFAEDDAVAIGQVGVLRIDMEATPVGGHKDIDARKGRAQMGRAGTVRHLDHVAPETSGDGFKSGEMFFR
jgi:hypothetical protein